MFKENKRTHLAGIRKIALAAGVFLLCILYWEYMLRFVRGNLEQLNFYIVPFAIAEAAALSVFSGWFSRKWNHAVNLLLILLIWFYYSAQLVYFKQFGSFISISTVGMGGAAIANFGWALMDNIRANIGMILLFAVPVAVYIVLIWPLKYKADPYSPLQHAIVLVLVAVIWVAAVQTLRIGGTGKYTAWQAYHDPYTDTDTAASRIGVLTTSIVEVSFSSSGQGITQESLSQVSATVPLLENDTQKELEPTQKPYFDTSPNVLNAIDFETLAEKATIPEYEELCRYFSGVEGTNRNEYTGLLKDYNVIMLSGESFSTAAVDPVLTPTLYELATNGIVLNNYYNSFKNTTTNGEFAFMTGLWPDVSRIADKGYATGSFCASQFNLMPYGLGNILKELDGTNSFAYHGYTGEYYNRFLTHPNLGYKAKFIEQGLSFSSTWPSSDLELFEQTVDDYINNDRFNVYYMTFSGHGTYTPSNSMAVRNLDTVKDLVGDRGFTETELCYLAGNYELEKAMTYLMKRLDEAGKLDNTVIILAGDHFPYGLTMEEYSDLMGGELKDDFDYMKSTCVFWAGGLEHPIETDTYCCNVDLLPTLLNLLGVEYDSRMLSGRDIFSDGPHVAMLYNKSFITDKVRFYADTGKAVWTEDAAGNSAESKQNYLEYLTEYTSMNYTAAQKVVSSNFYRFVWMSAGLKT